MKIKKYSLKYIIDNDSSIQTIEMYASDIDNAKMILKHIMLEQNVKSIKILASEEILKIS